MFSLGYTFIVNYLSKNIFNPKKMPLKQSFCKAYNNLFYELRIVPMLISRCNCHCLCLFGCFGLI